MGNRYKRVTDLFVNGKAVKLPDGTHLWVQAINSYERDECLTDASVARARLVLALKQDGKERIRIEALLAERGRDSLARELANRRASNKVPEIADDLRDDPEWKERMEVLRRTDFNEGATPATEEETITMVKINADILDEITKRETQELEYQQRRLDRMDDAEFLEEYMEAWLEKRSTAVMGAEYRLTELWYATRICEATFDELDELNHERCEGHRERLFASKAEARAIPDELQDLLREALEDLEVTGKDPKDSPSPASSSDLSPTPSAPEESRPSTSTETPSKAPGTSESPSPTP